MEQVIMFATMAITIIFGYIANRVSWFNSKLIPLQNISIGLVAAGIYYLYTKDFSAAVTMSGIMSTGIYSLTDNFTELFTEKKEDSQG